MNRLFIALFLLFLGLPASRAAKVKYPGRQTFVYRYYLRDKQGCGFSVDHPSRFLSPKAIERRKRQHLRIDSTDLPVSRKYVDLFRLSGAEVLGTSRWNNTVVVRSRDSVQLRQLATLSCVREARMVWMSPDSVEAREDVKWNIRSQFQKWDSVKYDPYGMGRPQIEMLGGERLHEVGLRGEGVTIAVLDGGFLNADRIPALRGLRLAGTRDFVVPQTVADGTFFTGIDHGTKVLSALAADAPEVMLGAATEATYWLLRCEDPDTEMPVEEDYWTMAAEFADSVGVDVISSSLGYNEYDDGMGTYRLQDLDGRTALISRSASLLAHKGIVLCNSAGNSGMNSWKKIGVPADADNILTVGAVSSEGKIAPFSSVGPSQDLRVKPDVVAMGSPATLISGKGMLTRDMGTSFSTPLISGLVACLWQGLPGKTALEIIDLVRQSATLCEEPDNVYGYGVPDFWRAYMVGKMQDEK